MPTAHGPAHEANSPPGDVDFRDLAPSLTARPVVETVRDFVANEVEPVTETFFELGAGRTGTDRWRFAPRQLELLEQLKSIARKRGIWNLFLTSERGMTHLDYAYVAIELGKNPLAPEAANCNPPDTGNMEVLARIGTPDQQRRWLAPLLAGEIRSAYAMSEPGVASADATNIATRAELDGEEWIVNGEKFFITGAGDPRCRILICMVLTDPDAPAKRRHSMLLIPTATPGVEIVGPMEVFGNDHAPWGHMHLRFDDVRVPRDAILLDVGRGFDVAQLRLGPGRIHHCMRAVGAAERALELMTERAVSRSAFGRPLARLSGTSDVIARARIDVEAMRLMVLQAARAMDVLPDAEARVWISMAKALVPATACRIIDEAIQLHGAAGLSQWFPLAEMYSWQRTLRFADGPDEVHRMVVARRELANAGTSA